MIKVFCGGIDCYANISLSGTSPVAKRRCKTGEGGGVVDPEIRAAICIRRSPSGRGPIRDRPCDTRDCDNGKFATPAVCRESEAAAACNLIKYYATDAN